MESWESLSEKPSHEPVTRRRAWLQRAQEVQNILLARRAKRLEVVDYFIGFRPAELALALGFKDAIDGKV
jgi:hypothetical protein